MARSVLWTEKQKTTCVEMAKKGYTSREISEVIKRTKGSIIGYLHRLGIRMSDYNPSGRPKTPKPYKPRDRKAVQDKKLIEIKEIPEVSLFEARMFQCRYITHQTGNIWETRCCGKPTIYKSWCQEHFKIVFRPREKQHERQAS
jgi:hypothetical protein